MENRKKNEIFEPSLKWKSDLDEAIKAGDHVNVESLLKESTSNPVILPKLIKAIDIHLAHQNKTDQLPIISSLLQKITDPNLIDALRVKFFHKTFYPYERLEKLKSLLNQRQDELLPDPLVHGKTWQFHLWRQQLSLSPSDQKQSPASLSTTHTTPVSNFFDNRNKSSFDKALPPENQVFQTITADI